MPRVSVDENDTLTFQLMLVFLFMQLADAT